MPAKGRGKGSPTVMEAALIAPCGMNCALCGGYLAWKHDVKKEGIRMPYCNGCRPRGKQCAYLKKWCHHLIGGEVTYCFQCGEFPCRRLTVIDRRYRSRYRMSMIENLRFMETKGVDALLRREGEKWECPSCGGVICCHNGICFDCGLEGLRTKKKPFRWED